MELCLEGDRLVESVDGGGMGAPGGRGGAGAGRPGGQGRTEQQILPGLAFLGVGEKDEENDSGENLEESAVILTDHC